MKQTCGKEVHDYVWLREKYELQEIVKEIKIW